MSPVQNFEETYVENTTGKVTVIWLCRILFFGCFFVAIFVANTIWKNEASWLGYVHETIVTGGLAKLDSENLFSAKLLSEALESGIALLQTILLQRLPVWLFLLVFGRSLCGIIGGQIYGACQGFFLGFLLSAMIIRYGFYGVVIFGMMGCPQMIAYIFAYVLLYRKNYLLWKRKKQSEKYGEIQPKGCSVSGTDIVGYTLLTVLFGVGIFLESYVNVIFLTKMMDVMKLF